MALYYYFLEDLNEEKQGFIEAFTGEDAMNQIKHKFNDPKNIRGRMTVL